MRRLRLAAGVSIDANARECSARNDRTKREVQPEQSPVWLTAGRAA